MSQSMKERVIGMLITGLPVTAVATQLNVHHSNVGHLWAVAGLQLFVMCGQQSERYTVYLDCVYLALLIMLYKGQEALNRF